MRVYFDNVIASGRVLSDLVPQSEMDAVHAIEAAHRAGRIKRVTSQESAREQGRTRDPMKRAKLADAAGEVSAVPTDYGALAPLLREESTHAMPVDTSPEGVLFTDLVGIGLKEADACHLVNTARSACVRFLTLDPDFLDRRAALEAACGGVRIMKPSELARELETPSGLDGAR